MGGKLYHTYQRRFEWKHEAKEFIKGLKSQAKKRGEKVVIKLLPEVKSISSVEYSESRVVGYWVKWYYKP